MGVHPASTMAENADAWQFLARISVCPGPQVASTAAWMPTVVPLTRNQVASAPKAAAARDCASAMTPVGEER